MSWYHLHPVAVHFPLALLPMGLVFEAASLFRPQKEWIRNASAALLWLGTLAAWITVGMGLIAEETAPHVPAAWATLSDHETLAWWAAGLFSCLSAVRIIYRERWTANPDGLRRAFVFLWLVSIAVLAAAGYHGGQLVFQFGMGVRSGG